MRACLVILSLMAFASCGKKQNELPQGRSFVSALEKKSFLTLSHEDNQSLIRSKLLNSIVEESHPSSKFSLENAVKKHDELGAFQMPYNDFQNYEEKEKAMAKVIVSYSDREDIYFLKSGMLLSDLPGNLNLTSESDRTFKWLRTDYLKTFTGVTFYLVSVNHEDLMENDKKFFKSEKIEVKELGKPLVFDSYTSVLLSVDYEFYLQKLASHTYEVQTGARRGCVYSKNAATEEYERLEAAPLNDLGLEITSANKKNSLTQDAINKKYEIELSSEDKMLNTFNVQMNQVASAHYEKASSVLINFNCGADFADNTNAVLGSKVNLMLSYRILGRGLELKKIKL